MGNLSSSSRTLLWLEAPDCKVAHIRLHVDAAKYQKLLQSNQQL